MKLRKISTALIAIVAIGLSSPVFAEKIGVTFAGDDALSASISETLKADGHEIVDIAAAVNGVKLDSVAAAAIGKSTGAEIIVSGKNLGGVVILKILSTKNDTVAGGTCPADNAAAASDQVKKILADNKAKLTQ